MARERDLTTLEVLGVAIKSEIEAIKLYRPDEGKGEESRSQDEARLPPSQEKNHERTSHGGLPEEVPRGGTEPSRRKRSSPRSTMSFAAEATLKELFAAAMEAEKKAETSTWSSRRRRTTRAAGRCSNTSRAWSGAISRSSRRSSAQLEITEDYNTDDFLRGERLMNVGP